MNHNILHGVTYHLFDGEMPGRGAKWPFSKMEIDDVVYFDCSNSVDIKEACAKVRTYSTSYGMRAGKKFTSNMDKTGIYIRRVE